MVSHSGDGHMDIFWQILLGNLATVALVMSVWMQAHPWLEGRIPIGRDALFGVAMGLGAILSMMMAVEVQPGVYFDLRHALIAMSGLFGGPVSVIIAGTISATFRIGMGGAGLGLGLSGILAAALLSAALRAVTSSREPNVKDVVALSFAMTAASFLIAASRFSPIEQFSLLGHSLVAMALNFTSVFVCGLILVEVRDHARDRDLARLALAQSPSYYYIKDRASRFRVVNQAVAALHGFERPADLRGMSDFDIIDAERAESLLSEEKKIMESGQAIIDKQEMLETAAGMKWYSTTKIPVRSDKGEIIGVAGVTHDITARKLMEQELASSRMHLDYAMREMSDGLALFSPTGHLVFCNEQYGAFFPLTAHIRTPGRHIRDILAAVAETGEQINIPEDQQEAWINEVSSNLLVDNDQEIRTQAGGWLQIRTRRTNDGSALVIVTDMTVMKESEIALRKMTEQLRSLAETDGLTGLLNRRVFDVRLEAAVEESSGDHPLSLLMIDVDRFKAYNDHYGHTAGDECLRAVAGCLRQLRTRPGDVVARYGGEEFAILLPDTDGPGAIAMGERLRRLLHEADLPHAASDLGKVTVSVGVGTMLSRRDPSWLIDLADDALYASKTGGRNRTTAA